MFRERVLGKMGFNMGGRIGIGFQSVFQLHGEGST